MRTIVCSLAAANLKATKNYTSYVKLKSPYVTYVVSAAPKWELKHYLWSFPIIGDVPYKGYFEEVDAKKEEEELKKLDLDTYQRGVGAYSTLGWFNDPILSSMLRYRDYDLVDTIIHETVHATLYFKSNADFNERIATFLGSKGAEMYYLETEGPESKTLELVKSQSEDEKLFSVFIGEELKNLKEWYQQLRAEERNDEKRFARIKEIQIRFEQSLLPNLKSDSYRKFNEVKLNNARLLVYKTYVTDLNDFAELYKILNGDFQKFVETCKSFESSANPELALRSYLKDKIKEHVDKK